MRFFPRGVLGVGAAVLAGALAAPGGSLRINEFMAVNDFTLKDEYGNSPDWIEIHNTAASNLSLAGWYLTDSSNDLRLWQFPATNIRAGGFLIVFASDRNQSEAGKPLHANFKLSSEGEYLALVQTDGVTIASEYSPAFPPQYADVSYGLSTNPGGERLYFLTPTPGATNVGGQRELGPRISDVTHAPRIPGDLSNIVVTARALDGTHGSVTGAVLHYVVMYGGETALPMYDDGAHGDGAAGDRVYGAAIPAAASSPGNMVRYYVTAGDSGGYQSRLPFFADPAAYFGTVIHEPSQPTNPPLLYWFVQGDAWQTISVSCFNYDTWKDGFTVWGDACLYFGGRFYSGVKVRRKGGSTFDYAPYKLKFEMPDGNWFQFSPTNAPVEEFNIQRFNSDGTTKMREPLCAELFATAGVPTFHTFYVRFRRNGAGTTETAAVVEQVDSRALARLGLDPDGSLYKATGCQFATPVSCSDLSTNNYTGYQASDYRKATRKYEDDSDLTAFRQNLELPRGSPQLRNYLFDNLGLPELINYMAMSVILMHCDRCEKNYYIYRDTNQSGEWTVLPWDLDLVMGTSGRGSVYSNPSRGETDTPSIYFGDYGDHTNFISHSWLLWYYGSGSGHNYVYTNSYNRAYDAVIRTAETRQMYLRRIRTLMDTLLQPSAGFLESRISAYESLIGTSGAQIRSYLSARRSQLFSGSGKYAEIPAPQAGSPRIGFGGFEAAPASGDQNEEYIELVNTNAAAVDLSGWRLTDGVEFTFKPGTVINAGSNLFVSPNVRAFRGRAASPKGGEGRFVQGGYRGNLADRGETVVLVNHSNVVMSSLSYTGYPSVYPGPLRVTELMYHPADADSEFIEFKNTGASGADLSGVRLTDGVTFDFAGSAVTLLGPGEHVVVVRNLTAFTNRYGGAAGIRIAGQYEGSLSDAGEELLVWSLADAAAIIRGEYNDARGWPLTADGAGHSLVPLVLDDQADGRLNYGGNWRASACRGGSPGRDDPEPVADVVFNEIMAHTDYTNPALPEYDSNDWLELFNRSGSAVLLADWYLSDDAANLRKWAIPATNAIAPGAWLAFDEVTGFHHPITNGFGLNKAGEQVFLSYLPGTTNDRVADGVEFAGQEPEFSLGRYPDGAAEWYALAPTRGAANALPAQHVVIGEIMYHPAPTAANPEDNTHDEFIELFNPTGAPVPFWNEVGAWRLDGGARFTFPSNVTLAAGARLLLVSFDPSNAAERAEFLDAYGLTNGAVVLRGPYEGRLSNDGDRLALERPQAPDLPGDPVNWVIVDEVAYFDQEPWPRTADGTGLSVQRTAGGFGAGAPQWAGVGPTPGEGPPKVYVSAPLNGSACLLPLALRVAASVDSNQVVGGVARVEFREGTNVFAADPEAPYEAVRSGVTNTGELRLTAAVVDGAGTTVSREVRVGVLALANGAASNVTDSAAVLCGTLAGSGEALVTVYWGIADGGTNAGAWAHAEYLGARGAGVFSAPVEGLALNQPYRYRCHARTANGEAWAEGSVLFEPSYQGWAHVMKIAFPGYNRSGVLTNFPALVRLSTNISGFAYGQFASPSGGDLRFTDAADLRVLNYEPEAWDTGGVSAVWVQVPRLAHGADFIWAHWGNAGAAQAPAYTTSGATWSEGFGAVWHLHNGVGDSTSNRVAATNYDSVAVAALVGNGRSFDGTGDYVDTDLQAAWYGENINGLTISLWVRPETANLATPFGTQGVARERPLYVTQSAGQWKFGLDDNFKANTEHAVTAGAWQMLTFVLRAGQAEAWKNGSPPSAAVPYAAFTPTHRPMLGRMNPQTDPAYFYRGQMDEVRVCRVARPADWIWATHMTMASNGAFTSYLIPSTPVPWDEDGDGMADAWEIQHLGDTNALPGDDEDEDGFSNLGEYTAGTVPTSAADRFEVDLSLSGSVGGVRFVTRAAGGPPHYPDMTRYYRLESASNLLDGGWYWVPGYDEILGAGQTVTYTNANWPAFYRGKAFLIQDGTP